MHFILHICAANPYVTNSTSFSSANEGFNRWCRTFIFITCELILKNADYDNPGEEVETPTVTDNGYQ
jgi:hypothetical protein